MQTLRVLTHRYRNASAGSRSIPSFPSSPVGTSQCLIVSPLVTIEDSRTSRATARNAARLRRSHSSISVNALRSIQSMLLAPKRCLDGLQERPALLAVLLGVRRDADSTVGTADGFIAHREGKSDCARMNKVRRRTPAASGPPRT